MAFIDVSLAQGTGIGIATPLDIAAALPGLEVTPPVENLTALEWRVVELARSDGLETLRPERKHGWLVRLILGPQPASPKLANERLEALRRLAVQASCEGYLLPVSAIKEAMAAGYSELQVGHVIDTIVDGHANLRKAAA